MRPIVCTTRGGQASRRTQERAIALAKETGAELIFLCVADPSFAEVKDEVRAAALCDELTRLGRSLLCMAESRAQKQAVKAQSVVMCGPVWQTVEEYLRQVNAGTLVIGAPQTGATLRPFDPGDMDRFIDRVRKTTDTEVVLVA